MQTCNNTAQDAYMAYGDAMGMGLTRMFCFFCATAVFWESAWAAEQLKAWGFVRGVDASGTPRHAVLDLPMTRVPHKS